MGRRDDFAVCPPGRVDRRYPMFSDAAGLVPAVLTGWTAAAQIRASRAPAAPVLFTFVCVVEASAVRITATSTDTAAWPAAWPARVVPWDLVLTGPDGTRYPPFVSGWITVRPPTTHS